MNKIQSQIQNYIDQLPDQKDIPDYPILDIEQGTIELQISPQLQIFLPDENIQRNYSKYQIQNLIEEDIFYQNDISNIIQQKQIHLSNLQNQQFQTNELIDNLILMAQEFNQPNLLIVNNRTKNNQFDILTGEFIGQREDSIDPRFKDYKVEDLDERNDPHLLGKQKIKKQTNIQTQQFDFLNVQQELFQLSETIEILQQNSLNNFNDQEIIQKNTDLMKIMSMTNEVIKLQNEPQFAKKQEIQQSNTLWDSLFLNIKKQDKKQKIQDDLQGKDQKKLQNILDQLSSDEETNKVDDKNKQEFEVIKLGQLKQATKSILNSGDYSYAIQDQSDISQFYYFLPKENFAMQYSFELDDFQKAAILHLEKKESVFVAAHTSAGKTVVAEYAIALAQKHKTRAVYTSPIKALSNQKYREFVQKFKDVGIITGDVTIKPESSCIIMTTEILRSMLYKGSDIIRDIEWVIFDEVHYVSNLDRGVVWEETIIMLPEHIGIIMLSATVPNAMAFADWVGRTKKRKIYVQMTQKRPVPLEHNINVLSKFHLLKEKDGPFLQNEYQFFINNIDCMKDYQKMDIIELKKKLKEEKQQKGTWTGKYYQIKDKAKSQKRKQLVTNMMTKKGGKFIQNVTFDDFQDKKHKNEYVGIQNLIKHCQKEQMLPCTIFCFSKIKIMSLADKLQSYDLCDKNESGKISLFFNKALKKLKPSDRELPQFIQLKQMLEKGYAVHHGDLLPLAKEIVEILYSEGLVKVLFATETFAMGVNMPAKTVIFFGLQKNDGLEFRYLKSSEYTQMSGRAGRRGLDEKGNVIVYMKDASKLPDMITMKQIIDTKGETLESKFRLTYAIILNLLTAKDIDVIEMMKRSFGENTKFSQLPRIKERIRTLKKQQDLLNQIDCPYVTESETKPIEDFYKCQENIQDMSKLIYEDQSFLSKVNFPKFALIQCINCQLELGIILSYFKKKDNDFDETIFYFKVLLLSKIESKKKILLKYEMEQKKQELIRQLQTDSTYGYRIVQVKSSEIYEIFQDKIQYNTNSDNVQNDHRLLQFLADEIKQRLENPKKKLQKLNLKFGELNDLVSNKEIQVQSMLNNKCNSCTEKINHFSQLENRKQVMLEIKDLLKNTDEDNLSLIDDFSARQLILQKLNYIDKDKVPLIKARIARELSDNEIFLCEVLMENVLDDLEPNEIAAVLSCFICQYKSKNPDQRQFDLNEKILDAMGHIEEIIQKIAYLEMEQHIFFEDLDDYIQSKVNFNHVKVVFDWANQMDFVEVCQMTESQEGTIVKTIQRLDILLKDVKNATKVMGNMNLCKKIEEASQLIKRDIVFCTSLYLE